MNFRPLAIAGAFVIDIEAFEDFRGLFARTFCADEFAAIGLTSRFVQCSTSFNKVRGTLRGLHFQREPMAEEKLVRCTRGAVWDVVLDLRTESPTYKRWEAVELSEVNRRSIFVPGGLAHGFQALEDNSEVLYQMTEFYSPQLSAGVRWDDPAFNICWPVSNPVLSLKDAGYADFS